MHLTSESLAALSVMSSALVAIAVPWLSYRFSRMSAADERRFQKRSDAYTRLMMIVERHYEIAFWSYPSHRAEPPAAPTEAELNELDVLLTIHASERIGLLLREFNLARKRVHNASFEVLGIKNATDMGMQSDVEKAYEVSASHEVERGVALEWLLECRNNLRAQVRLELHGSPRRLSLRDRGFAKKVRDRAMRRRKDISIARDEALAAVRSGGQAPDEP